MLAVIACAQVRIAALAAEVAQYQRWAAHAWQAWVDAVVLAWLGPDEAAGQLYERAQPAYRLLNRPFDGRGPRCCTGSGCAGTVAPGRRGGPAARLTPPELQIVGLAARGLSNRDIAAQLFPSARMVGYNLYKAYPKLGVASGAELVDLDLAGTLTVRDCRPGRNDRTSTLDSRWTRYRRNSLCNRTDPCHAFSYSAGGARASTMGPGV